MIPVGQNNGLWTYDPKDIIITIGPNILSGFAPDSKVSITTDNDLYTHTASVDGDVYVRNKNNDRTATITIKLLQGSGGNTIMSNYYSVDLLSNAGHFAITISLKGIQTPILASTMAYISKEPDINLNKEVDTYEWKIKAINPTIYLGQFKPGHLVSNSNLDTPI